MIPVIDSGSVNTGKLHFNIPPLLHSARNDRYSKSVHFTFMIFTFPSVILVSIFNVYQKYLWWHSSTSVLWTWYQLSCNGFKSLLKDNFRHLKNYASLTKKLTFLEIHSEACSRHLASLTCDQTFTTGLQNGHNCHVMPR